MGCEELEEHPIFPLSIMNSYVKIIIGRCENNFRMPACRNGRRGRLKICCGQPRVGSSPTAGT